MKYSITPIPWFRFEVYNHTILINSYSYVYRINFGRTSLLMALKKIHPGAEISISSSLTFQVILIFSLASSLALGIIPHDMTDIKHSSTNSFIFIGHSIVQETRVLQAILQFWMSMYPVLIQLALTTRNQNLSGKERNGFKGEWNQDGIC